MKHHMLTQAFEMGPESCHWSPVWRRPAPVAAAGNFASRPQSSKPLSWLSLGFCFFKPRWSANWFLWLNDVECLALKVFSWKHAAPHLCATRNHASGFWKVFHALTTCIRLNKEKHGKALQCQCDFDLESWMLGLHKLNLNLSNKSSDSKELVALACTSDASHGAVRGVLYNIPPLRLSFSGSDK